MAIKMPELRIGISGTIGSGKDTAANYAADKYGLMHFSTGDFLRGEAVKLGQPIERETLSDIANNIHEQYQSLGALVFVAIEQYQDSSEEYNGLLMSGLRVFDEAKEFKNQGGTLLFTNAPNVIRHQRVVARGRGHESKMTLDEFNEVSEREYFGVGDETKPNLMAVRGVSDYVIHNANTRDDFIQKIDHKISRLIEARLL